MSQKKIKLEAEEQRLVEYLNSFDGNTTFPRVTCCNSSRSLYCNECCRLLVPDDVLPDSISLRREVNSSASSSDKADTDDDRQRPLKLPFNLRIVLDDRRGSATGLHAVTLLNNESNNGSVKLIDIANGDGDDIANYQRSIPEEDNNSIDPIEQPETTFLLFPTPGESVPIESVAHQIETLVVLDCKWTKSSLCRKNANLMKLKKVHLSNTYATHYWRWHNAGDGCVSTIEAIYYAAMEVSEQKYLQQQALRQSSYTLEDHLADKRNLMGLLWLFGHQRAATIQAAERDGKPAPGTVEAKEQARALRKQTGEYAWRSERNKEIGKILKEECRRMKQLALKDKE